jgi:YidC/Oxa1 family membrane protein insertase
MIFIALPFVFVAFVINFPAGLLVYWITTNLWTIVQQAIVRKRLGPMRPPGSDTGMGLGDLFRGGASPAPATGGATDAGTRSPRPRARGNDSGGTRAREPSARPAGPPPSPPRRKKKRSGRRR